MSGFKFTLHMGFQHLTEKRTFCRKLNKFRRHGLIEIRDLGRDEDTGNACVEFAFPTQEALDSFCEVVEKNAKANNILQDE